MYNATSEPNGLAFWVANTISPTSGSSSNGVSIVMSPSLADAGHDGGSLVPKPICAGEQAPKPAAEDGDTETPSGKVIFTRRTAAVAVPPGSWGCGTLTTTSSPD